MLSSAIVAIRSSADAVTTRRYSTPQLRTCDDSARIDDWAIPMYVG